MKEVELDKEQLWAIENLRTGKILVGDTGSGKSRTSLGYFFYKVARGKTKLNGEGGFEHPKTPLDLYIITTAKKRDTLDWEEDALNFQITTNRETSAGGIKLTVDSWNNIKKYTDVKGSFFIFDEQRLVGSGAWVKAFYKIAKANDWILLTATPGDTWMDYVPVFVANGFYKNKTHFSREHVIYSTYTKFPKVEKFYSTKKLERLRDEISVEMAVPRHTTRHRHQIMCEYNLDLWKKVVRDRWNPFKDEPIENVSEFFVCMRRVVNSDPSRLRELSALLQDIPKVIVYYNFDYELEALRALLGALEVRFSEWNGHNHDPIPEGDRWVYLVQYTAGAEAWNCVETDSMIFFSLNYSYRVTYQCEGRIDRRNTPYTDLHYYYLRSASPIDVQINRALTLKKTFNERDFMKRVKF